MDRKKLITGAVVVAVCALLVVLLVWLAQRLLISGTEFIDGLGALLVEEGEYSGDMAGEAFVEPQERLGTVVEGEGDTEIPEPALEPEELVEIPIEQTPEELAQEYLAEQAEKQNSQ